MKKAVLPLIVLTSVLASCGQSSNQDLPTAQASNQLYSGAPFRTIDEAMKSDKPIIVITDTGILKNNAFIKQENEAPKAEDTSKSPNLQAQALCNYPGYGCTVSTQWTYKGNIKGNRTLYTTVLNNTDFDSPINITASKSNGSTISGGIDYQAIKVSIGWNNSSTLTTQVTGTAKKRATTYVYTWEVCTGGYGTQYSYPNTFTSCYQAKTECISSNFSAANYTGLGYELSYY